MNASIREQYRRLRVSYAAASAMMTCPESARHRKAAKRALEEFERRHGIKPARGHF